MNVEFAWPWLLASLPLPLFVAQLCPRAPEKAGAALRIPFFAAVRAANSANLLPRSRLRLSLAALAWVLLVVAASRPQFVGDPLQMPVSGRDLMVAVDISGSMAVQDMVLGDQAADRLTAVKAVAGEFIERREGDRVGLILFGKRAYLQTPLTFDRQTVRTLLDESVVGLAGKETAIGDAIGLAVKRLREQPQANRALVLLTDGANTAGAVDPLKAADLAAAEDITVYTIGVGAEEMVVDSFLGAQRVNPSADLDEKALTAIAQKTNGRYYRARDIRSLREIYELLDDMEPVSLDHATFRPVRELYRWPLGGALMLVALAAIAASGLGIRRRPQGLRYGG